MQMREQMCQHVKREYNRWHIHMVTSRTMAKRIHCTSTGVVVLNSKLDNDLEVTLVKF